MRSLRYYLDMRNTRTVMLRKISPIWMKEGDHKEVSGRCKIFAFTYKDLASLYGITEQSLKDLVCKGKLDPSSFKSICEHYLKFAPK